MDGLLEGLGWYSGGSLDGLLGIVRMVFWRVFGWYSLDGILEGLTDGLQERLLEGCIEGLTDGLLEGCTEGLTDSLLEGLWMVFWRSYKGFWRSYRGSSGGSSDGILEVVNTVFWRS